MKPILGSFYIIDGAIYYSTLDNGLDHRILWKEIVNHVFTKLDYENRMELHSAFYGTDRGRIVWTGDLDRRGNPIPGTGKYNLYGTPGCKLYKGTIMNVFRLNDLEPDELKIDWITDEHYKVMPADKAVVDDMKMLLKNKVRFHDMHLATKKQIFLQKVLAKI